MSDSPWLDSRRLIGPNLLWDRPGALLEVAGEEPEFSRRIEVWSEFALALMQALEWPGEETRRRVYPGGALLVLSAPVNALFTATEVNEEAWTLACSAAGAAEFDHAVQRLQQALQAEAVAAALAIYQAARKRCQTCLVDELGVSIGSGCRGRFWPLDELPSVDSIDWQGVADVPTALVTGTNGKTTSVRLLSAMIRAAGISPGLSSTDWIQVGEQVLDQGDYSGPGGARQVLRDPRTEIAVLETARGGLLRRGLALQKASVALVTNIAEDHLGDGGILTLDDLAEVKFMVTAVLGTQGTAVLNWDDAHCRAHGKTLAAKITWFSLQPPPGDVAPRDDWFWYDGRQLKYNIAGTQGDLIAAQDAPITLGGSARHNIANALGAAATATALGVPMPAIKQALQSFGQSIDDNPGRGNLVEINGIKVLLDFAHNPDGMQVILEAGKAMGARRMAVVFGQAGDRTDDAIRDLTAAVVEAGPELVVIKEMGEYRRGREPGEILAVIRSELLRLGVENHQIAYAETEIEASELAFHWAREGDLLMLFIHSDRDAVLEHLRKISIV